MKKNSIALCCTKNMFTRLHKAAKARLKALNAERFTCEHIVFGIERNVKGQLGTFFIPLKNDKELWAYADAVDDYVFAVHASRPRRMACA